MDITPEKPPRANQLLADGLEEQIENQAQGLKIKKPPPITPRRFTRFFTPRPRNAAAATVKTSRAALKVLSSSTLNSRNTQSLHGADNDVNASISTPRSKKRKLSFVTNDSVHSTPAARVSFLHSSQEIRSSPTIPERRSPLRRSYGCAGLSDDEEAETDIEMDDEECEAAQPPTRIIPYRSKTTSNGIFSTRLSGSRVRCEPGPSDLWQQQTGHFYSSPLDVNNSFSHMPVALPFSVAACNTNPIIATGDEEGTIRVMDSSAENEHGLTRTFFQMKPHDNALMDLEFSPDDAYLATACGDQSCQIIDMRTQTSLYTLSGHRCSVKKISFQPGSGNNILASCGRDGQLNFWDLRCVNTRAMSNSRRQSMSNPMTTDAKYVTPTHGIRDAHTAGPKSAKAIAAKAKPNLIPGRADFSVTSLSFLGGSRPHLLVTASEIDTTIKVWDIRTHHSNSRRAPTPLSCTEEPKSHAFHRRFGVTSLVVNSDATRLYALSRDHTVYAYSTAHLILGSSNHLSSRSKPSKPAESGKQGLGPLYGFRHASLRVQTFWPRLSIRRRTEDNTELLAVGSTEDCAILFPTDERYLTKSTMNVVSHQTGTSTANSSFSSRPSPLTRSTSTSSVGGSFRMDGDEGIKVYNHGTALIRGHDKEVTSVAWTSEGSLITASDDYTVRCWREDAVNARRMRDQGERNGERWKRGWADVALDGFDEEC